MLPAEYGCKDPNHHTPISQKPSVLDLRPDFLRREPQAEETKSSDRQVQRKHPGGVLPPEMAKRLAVAPPHGDARSPPVMRRTQSSGNGSTDVAARGAAASVAWAQEAGAGLRRPASSSHLWVRFIHGY